MWTFMIIGLACGSRIILYDGSPFYPDLKTYLKFVGDQGSVHSSVTHRTWCSLLLNLKGNNMGTQSSIYGRSTRKGHEAMYVDCFSLIWKLFSRTAPSGNHFFRSFASNGSHRRGCHRTFVWIRIFNIWKKCSSYLYFRRYRYLRRLWVSLSSRFIQFYSLQSKSWQEHLFFRFTPEKFKRKVWEWKLRYLTLLEIMWNKRDNRASWCVHAHTLLFLFHSGEMNLGKNCVRLTLVYTQVNKTFFFVEMCLIPAVGVWRQGDFIVVNPVTKGLVILGRRWPFINIVNISHPLTPIPVMESWIPVVFASGLAKYTQSWNNFLTK